MSPAISHLADLALRHGETIAAQGAKVQALEDNQTRQENTLIRLEGKVDAQGARQYKILVSVLAAAVTGLLSVVGIGISIWLKK